MHRGNRFRIRVREVGGDREAVEQRLALVRERGVPNYFGEQRFGRDADNIAQARAYVRRHAHARARTLVWRCRPRARMLFNAVLATRVADGSWDSALDGDVWMLAGTHSDLRARAVDRRARAPARRVRHRSDRSDVGAGELRTTGLVRALEERAIAPYRDLAEGLARAGLAQQRRALRLRVDGLVHQWESDGALVLEFRLPAGAFATVVLRELSGEVARGLPGR